MNRTVVSVLALTACASPQLTSSPPASVSSLPAPTAPETPVPRLAATPAVEAVALAATPAASGATRLAPTEDGVVLAAIEPLLESANAALFPAASGCPQVYVADLDGRRLLLAYASLQDEGGGELLLGGWLEGGKAAALPAAALASVNHHPSMSCPTLEVFIADPDGDQHHDLVLAIDQGGPPAARFFVPLVYAPDGSSLKEAAPASAPFAAADSMAKIFAGLGLPVPPEYGPG